MPSLGDYPECDSSELVAATVTTSMNLHACTGIGTALDCILGVSVAINYYDAQGMIYSPIIDDEARIWGL